MGKTIECCNGCTERHFDEQGRTCHSTCERYITEKKALTELNRKIQAENTMRFFLGAKRVRRYKKTN